MIERLKRLLGLTPAVDFAALVRDGAKVIDVRTKAEFAGGHIKGSVNIPLADLTAKSGKMPGPDKVLVLCCASGMRSSTARGILRSKGYKNVYNGGSWRKLEARL